MKKSRVVALTLVLATFALMLTACAGEQRMGAWIENHVQESGDKLADHVQGSQEHFENDSVLPDDVSPEKTQENQDTSTRQSDSWIENHIREGGDKLWQHIEQSENRLNSLIGKE